MTAPAMAQPAKAQPQQPVNTQQNGPATSTITSTSNAAKEAATSLQGILKLGTEITKRLLSKLDESDLTKLNNVVNKSAALLDQNKETLEAVKKIVENFANGEKIVQGLEKIEDVLEKINNIVNEVLEEKKKQNKKDQTEEHQEQQIKVQESTQKDVETLLKDTERLLEEKGIYDDRRQEILNDIRETIKNPDKINQGEFSTCVASSAINSAIKEGKASVLIEVFNEQIEKSDTLVSSLNSTYGDKAFKGKGPKMLGGSLQAALMSYASEGYVFNEDGSTEVKTADAGIQTIQGLTDKQIIKLHDRLNATETMYFDQLNSVEDLEEFLKANKGGVNVKLRWGSGNHTFHMVNIVGVDSKGNVIIKNSQDEKVANRHYDKNGLEKLSWKDFQENLCFGVIEKVPQGLEDKVKKGSEIKETFSAEQGDCYVHLNEDKTNNTYTNKEGLGAPKSIEEQNNLEDEEKEKNPNEEENVSTPYDPFIKEEKAKEQLDYLKDYKYLIEYYERLKEESKRNSSVMSA